MAENKKESLLDKAKNAMSGGNKKEEDNKEPEANETAGAAPAADSADATNAPNVDDSSDKKEDVKVEDKADKKEDAESKEGPKKAPHKIYSGPVTVKNISENPIGLNALGNNDVRPFIMLGKGESHTFERTRDYHPYSDSVSAHKLNDRVEIEGAEMNPKHKVLKKDKDAKEEKQKKLTGAAKAAAEAKAKREAEAAAKAGEGEGDKE